MKGRIKRTRNTNAIYKVIVGLFLFLLFVGIASKQIQTSEPIKASTPLDETYVENKLLCYKVRRSEGYMYIYFRDPSYFARELEKIKLYPFKPSGEMGELFASRREFQGYRIKAEKGFVSVKADYDGKVYYFNEVDYEVNTPNELSKEELITEYIDDMIDIHQKYIILVESEITEFEKEKEVLKEKRVELEGDLVFSAENEKTKTQHEQREIDKELNHLDALILNAQNIKERHTELKKVRLEEKDYILEGKISPLGNEEKDSGEEKTQGKFKTFRFKFSHINDEGKGVYDKYYTLDTSAEYMDAKFYKTDLKGNFMVDFRDVESDYLFLREEKKFDADSVDEGIKVVYINPENGLLEITNKDLNRHHFELTLKDQDGNILAEKTLHISANEDLSDFLEYRSNSDGVVKIPNLAENQSHKFYLKTDGSSDVVLLESLPATLMVKELLVNIPQEKPEAEDKSHETKPLEEEKGASSEGS